MFTLRRSYHSTSEPTLSRPPACGLDLLGVRHNRGCNEATGSESMSYTWGDNITIPVNYVYAADECD